MRPFHNADATAAVALLQRAFGRWPHGDFGVPASELFAWKHTSSPFGPSRMSVAEVDATIVGFIARMPWQLSFAGSVRDAARVVDIAVDPSAQRAGVAMELIGSPRANYGPEVALSWSNPNEQSRRRADKAGLALLQLHRYVGLGYPRGFATPGARPTSAVSAAELLDDDRLLARVLDWVPDPQAIETALDPGFLRWRYASFDVYRAVTVTDRRGCAALAIFRIGKRGRWSIAHVCEMLVQGRDPGLARRALRAVRRASGARMLTVARPPGGVAVGAGLIRSPRTHAISVNVLHEALAPDPTSTSSWSLSLGDLELV